MPFQGTRPWIIYSVRVPSIWAAQGNSDDAYIFQSKQLFSEWSINPAVFKGEAVLFGVEVNVCSETQPTILQSAC